MTKLITKLALAGGLALATASSVMAAPVSQADRNQFRAMERHDARDTQTGNYAPHGTLSTQKGQFLGRDAWGSTKMPQIQIQSPRPSADFPS